MNKLSLAWVPCAIYQNSWKSVHLFQKRCFMEFYHIWDWQPSWPRANTMIGRSVRFYIPRLVEIGPPAPEKKILEGFLPYMGVATILDM